MYPARATDSSDLDPTMAASRMFENLLHQIKYSNLNFRLEESPFAAVISLKKSLVKNKTGTLLMPPLQINPSFLHGVQTENRELSNKILRLEKAANSLQGDYENALSECEESNKIQVELERIIEELRNKVGESTEATDKLHQKRKETEHLVVQNKNYKQEVKSVGAKFEIIKDENKALRNEKDNLQKEVYNLSVSLKSARKETKDLVKEKDIHQKKLETEIESLLELKRKGETEAKILKKKQKKIAQKQKKEIKMSALEEQDNYTIEEKSSISGIQALDHNENLEPAADTLASPYQPIASVGSGLFCSSSSTTTRTKTDTIQTKLSPTYPRTEVTTSSPRTPTGTPPSSSAVLSPVLNETLTLEAIDAMLEKHMVKYRLDLRKS